MTFLIGSSICSTGNCDEYLDAVVEFLQPPGSNFAAQSHGNVLGAPDDISLSIDTPEVLTVAFIDNFVFDGPGFDLMIEEDINGDSSADIFGSADGIKFEFLLQANGSVEIDLADHSLNTIVALRFVGLDNGGGTDGFDVDAAIALNSVDVDFGCPTDFHVDTIIDFEQPPGSHITSQPISNVFGSPDAMNVSIDTPEVLTVAFSAIQVVDGPGPDMFLYEHINGDSDARILGSSDGKTFEFLLQTDRSASIDLANFELDSIRFLKVEGLQNGGTAPGYEFDAAVAINFECVNVIPGDVNLDGEVNLLDVMPFVAVLSNGFFQLQADTNNDGVVDLLDVATFVQLIQ